jgi:DNA-binding LacI/PurR family transcriptional regulator
MLSEGGTQQMVQYALSKGYKNLGLLSDTSASGAAAITSWKSALAGSGARFSVATVDTNVVDATPVLQHLQQAKADVSRTRSHQAKTSLSSRPAQSWV